MSLRTRLILAFFLLSVVPLTAITLYSYRSSAQALRGAAEAEGQQAATEMSRRMEVVTAELSNQLDRLWDLPREPRAARRDEQVDTSSAEQIARVLGTTASLFDRLEFVPQPPAPPAPATAPSPAAALAPPPPATAKPRRPAPPAAPSSDGRDRRATSAPPALPAREAEVDAARAAAAEAAAARVEVLLNEAAERVAAEAGAASDAKAVAEARKAVQSEPIVVDVAGALQEAAKAINDRHAKAGEPPPPWVQALTKGLAESLQSGAEITAAGLRLGALEMQRHAGTTPQALAGHRWWRGDLGVPIARKGRVVGTVNAKLNKERLLGAVFGLARTDQGEVPFAVDEDGHLFTPAKAQKPTLESLGVLDVPRDTGALRVESHDNWVIVKRRDASGMTLGIARPLGDSLEALRRATVQNLVLGLLVIGIAAIGIIPISHRMTRDLSTLAATAAQVAHGNFRVRVPVRSQDEIGRLSAAFNRMAEGVEAHQKLVVEQERLQQELDLCRRIQTEMLPHEALKLGFAEVKGVSIPAREVGGDFFNYFALDDGQIALLVGDVSGKGVGAALLMANVQATLRARVPLEQDLATLVDAIDRDVDERTPGGVFVTLFVGILDRRARRLRYVNAWHHPQFVLRNEGGLERMPSAGLPVGLFAGHGYQEHEMPLSDGDLLFFYTDGTIETENEAGEMFGFERLETLLQAHHDGDLDTVLTRVETELRTFRGNAELFDDATMMALRVGATGEAPVVG